MEYYGMTDIGKKRNKNQDQYFVGDIHGFRILIIADGMGGHLSGEVASEMAVNGFIQAANEELSDAVDLVKFVKKTIKNINDTIYKKSQDNVNMRGMGTTLVVAIEKDGIAHVFHIGDSRMYLWHDEALKLVTQDHSLINELKKQNRYSEEEEISLRHIITRSLGTEPKVEADYSKIELNKGDYLLLCTDGLSDDVSSGDIEKIIGENIPVKLKIQKLLNKALESGGKDNITICLMKYEE